MRRIGSLSSTIRIVLSAVAPGFSTTRRAPFVRSTGPPSCAPVCTRTQPGFYDVPVTRRSRGSPRPSQGRYNPVVQHSLPERRAPSAHPVERLVAARGGRPPGDLGLPRSLGIGVRMERGDEQAASALRAVPAAEGGEPVRRVLGVDAQLAHIAHRDDAPAEETLRLPIAVHDAPLSHNIKLGTLYYAPKRGRVTSTRRKLSPAPAPSSTALVASALASGRRQAAISAAASRVAPTPSSPASGPKAPPVAHTGPLTWTASSPPLGRPLTGKPNSGPCAKFQLRWKAIGSQSRPVAR